MAANVKMGADIQAVGKIAVVKGVNREFTYEATDIVGRLVPMQLDGVKGVAVDGIDHLWDSLIHEHPHPFALRGEIVGTFTHVATGPRPEDEAHQVDAQRLDLADILRLAHAADFHEHGSRC